MAKRSISKIKVIFLGIQLVTVASLLSFIYLTIENSVWGVHITARSIIPHLMLSVVIIFMMIKTLQSTSLFPVVAAHAKMNQFLILLYLCICFIVLYITCREIWLYINARG